MRLITSLTHAAAVLADQAADRLDAWAENQAPAEAPRETPLGFTPATGPDAPDPVAVVNARAAGGLTGEQRTRWLAEVNGRLDASTGGPWCTEERDTPTGRIYSPYGVIATGVTREADRDLIENARADLYGLLALAEHDDDVIAAWGKAAAAQAARRHEAERELEGMHYRERQVDRVVTAWDNQHGTLKGYNGTIDPETPAGRVVQLLHDLCKARPHTIASNTARYQALDAISANLREHGLSPADGDYATGITDAVRLALADRAEALETVDDLRRKLDAHHRHDATEADDPFMPAAEARQHAHTIKVALDMYDKGTDPLASLVLHHPLDLSGRVAALASHALQLGKRGDTDIDKGGAMYYAGMRDAAALAPEETIQAVKQAAAARIREAADEYATEAEENPGNRDLAEASAYYAGMSAAASIAEDIEPAPDAAVAHIDTVNGRADAENTERDDDE